MSTNNSLEKNKSYEPVVFVNKPITNSNEDVIGFENQINILNEAVLQGARIIGVIADYGTGKSSLTELFVHSIEETEQQKSSFYKKKNCSPIYVNLWDSLNKRKITQEASVSVLTHSFLYQLSNGYDTRFGKHINRLLSKNYENVSFSFNGSSKNYFFLIFAGFLFALYLISGISGTGIIKHLSTSFNVELNTVDTIGSVIKIVGPIFLLIAIILLYLGLKDKSVAFSHWKMPNRREPGISDVYDIYNIIIEKLTPKDDAKRYIIINDLDRIDNEELCIDFLKELYRFQEALGKNKDKFVFIISVKPKLNQTKDKLFSKIFDYTLYLKPVHFDDYDSLLLKLLENNPEQKKKLENLIRHPIDGYITDDFKWIKKGENLTLRDIKERLNQSISIMLSLRNKNYKVKSSVKFQPCAAVTFLENSYSEEYYLLIKHEEKFAKFIRESREIVDSKNKTNEILADLKNKCNDIFNDNGNYMFSDSFVTEFCGMVCGGVFNDDYRMYFYTYPKGSHIKTTDERDLCDALLFPNTSSVVGLEGVIERIFANGTNSVIEEAIKTLDDYPEIVVEYEKLFELATKINIEKSFRLFLKELFSDSILDYKVDVSRNILCLNENLYSKFVLLILKEFMNVKNSKNFLSIRVALACALQDKIIDFIDLFRVKQMPLSLQITKEEIDYIAKEETCLTLIDIENLKDNDVEYISNFVNSCDFSNNENLFNKAKMIMLKFNEISEKELIGNFLLEFLIKNNYVDADMFVTITSNPSLDRKKLINYLCKLESYDLPIEYFECIDKLRISRGLPDNLLIVLMENGYFITPIISLYTNGKLDLLKPYQGSNVEKILETLKNINESQNIDDIRVSDIIGAIRQFLRFGCRNEEYNSLFFSPFKMVTAEECYKIEDNDIIIQLIDTTQITEDNFGSLMTTFYYKTKEPIHVVNLFDRLFNEDVNTDYIYDIKLRCALLNNIDFDSLELWNLNENQREHLYSILKSDLNVKTSDEAIEVIKKWNCLVPSLEKIVIEKDEDRYCSLIAEQDEFTSVSIEWLDNNYLRCALSGKLCNKLLEYGNTINFVIGDVLRKKNMIVNPDIDFGAYIKIYKNVEEMFDIMSDHWEFLEKLQEKVEFKDLTEEQIIPMFKTKQKERFFKYIFSNESSEKLKERYITEFGELATSKDSKVFQELMCQEENLKRLDDIEKYKYIHHRLWTKDEDGNRLYHQMKFTTAWNKCWQGKLTDDDLVKV